MKQQHRPNLPPESSGFAAWLEQQAHRDHAIGDLARAAALHGGIERLHRHLGVVELAHMASQRLFVAGATATDASHEVRAAYADLASLDEFDPYWSRHHAAALEAFSQAVEEWTSWEARKTPRTATGPTAPVIGYHPPDVLQPAARVVVRCPHCPPRRASDPAWAGTHTHGAGAVGDVPNLRSRESHCRTGRGYSITDPQGLVPAVVTAFAGAVS